MSGAVLLPRARARLTVPVPRLPPRALRRWLLMSSIAHSRWSYYLDVQSRRAMHGSGRGSRGQAIDAQTCHPRIFSHPNAPRAPASLPFYVLPDAMSHLRQACVQLRPSALPVRSPSNNQIFTPAQPPKPTTQPCLAAAARTPRAPAPTCQQVASPLRSTGRSRMRCWTKTWRRRGRSAATGTSMSPSAPRRCSC